MTDSSSPKVEAAKDQASELKDTAVSSGQHVAETAADQAGSVVGEAKVQAKDLLGQAQSELRDQAGAQQKVVAKGLRSVSDELTTMADGSQGGGMATDLVQQAASRTASIASWLEDRDPGTLLSDVRSYAARKPGTFIAVAAVAGILAGRLTRSLAGNAKDEKEAEAAAPAPVADVPATTGYVDPSYTSPALADPAYGDTTLAGPAYADTAVPAQAATETTYASPAPATPSFDESTSAVPAPATSSFDETAYADAAPIDDVSLHSHNVDDEYGDRATVESLFDETAPTKSFDETVQGDDYRGDRS